MRASKPKHFGVLALTQASYNPMLFRGVFGSETNSRPCLDPGVNSVPPADRW